MYPSLLQISKLDYKTKMDASKEASIFIRIIVLEFKLLQPDRNLFLLNSCGHFPLL